MRILCLAKPVPDVDGFQYDYETNTLVRENVHMILNPEDATALAVALDVKRLVPGTRVETITMAPESAVPHLEDLIRRGVDRAILISDPCYAGSDTFVTSRILSRCIEDRSYDWIFGGSHSLDGGTAHVPGQVAQCLDLPQMSNIIEVDRDSLTGGPAVVEVDTEEAVLRFEMDRPALLGFQYSTTRKLPYIRYEDIDRDVRGRVRMVDNSELGFDRSEVGLQASLTRVAKIEVKTLHRKDTLVVGNDDEGIEAVYQILKRRGFLAS